jgi:hypothetical protein
MDAQDYEDLLMQVNDAFKSLEDADMGVRDDEIAVLIQDAIAKVEAATTLIERRIQEIA